MSSTASTHPSVGWAEALPTDHALSADDWAALPADRWRYEIVSGQLLRLPAADLRYDLIAGDFLRTIGIFVQANALGRVTLADSGFLVSAPGEPDTVLVPAVAFVRAEHAPDEAEKAAYLRVVPDLVIEVAAPGQLRPALAEKAALWLGAGARLVWVVWPNRRQVEVSSLVDGVPSTRTLSADETLDGGEVLTGFSVSVQHIFL
jgi:Uma2 family endonuclease